MNVIPESELKKCPKCGKSAIYVEKDGMGAEEPTGLVSCRDWDCMPPSEFYTVKEWQVFARPESPESRADHELAAAELSIDVRDVRLEHALDLLIDIAAAPYVSAADCALIAKYLDLHPSFDNPALDAKAARLRELVS
jgi:hypothetical protein